MDKSGVSKGVIKTAIDLANYMDSGSWQKPEEVLHRILMSLKYGKDMTKRDEKIHQGDFMPITIQDIKDHKDQFGLHDLDTMSIEEYQKSLSSGAFFWIDHHDFVRSTLSEEILATNREQLEVLIKHLQSFNGKMSP